MVVCAQSTQPAPFPAPQRTASKPRKADQTPPALFPVQGVWTLALNNMLTVPAAYEGTRAFFAIEGDRLVAYDIVSGEQRWLVPSRTQLQPAAGDDLLFVVEPDALVARHVKDGAVAWQLAIAG